MRSLRCSIEERCHNRIAVMTHSYLHHVLSYSSSIHFFPSDTPVYRISPYKHPLYSTHRSPYHFHISTYFLTHTLGRSTLPSGVAFVLPFYTCIDDTHNTGYLELLDCVHVTQEFLKVFARGALTQCVRVTKSRTLDHYHDATFSEAMKLASRDTVVFINKTVVRVPSAVVMELRDVLDEDGKGKISKAEFMERSSVLKTDRVRLPLLLAIAESFAFRVSHYWGHRFDHHQQEIKTQKEQKAPLKSASNDNKSKSSGASSYRNRPVYTGSSDSIIDIKCLMKAYQRLQLSDLGGSGGLVSSSSSLRSSRNHHRSNSRSSAGDQDEHLITSKRLKKLLIDDCGISPSTALDYVDQFSQYYDFQHTGRISIEAFIREYKRMSLFQCITAIKRQARQRGKDKNTSAHSRSTYSGNSTNQHYNNKDMGNTGVEGVSITWKELEQHLLRVMTPESAIKQLTALGYRHYNYTHNHNHNHKHTHNTASSTSRHRHSSGSSSSNNSSGINDEHKHEGGKNENENKQNNDNGGDNDYGTADGGSLPLSYVEGTGSITLAELEAWYTQHSEDVLLGYKGEYGDIQPGEEGGTATLCLGSAGYVLRIRMDEWING